MRLLLVVLTLFGLGSAALALSDAELETIGRKVWKNECNGTREGLTSWNAGENFASLGIGHFIWYPKGPKGPFEESFPKLVKFLKANGAKVPAWLQEAGACPWSSRAEFQAAAHSAKMNELRDLLAATVRLQSRFLANRLEAALPKMRAEAAAARRANVEKQFARMASTGSGMFAMIDYVNFKGEGTKSTERYQGEGWGLLQVLEKMEGRGPGAPREFAQAAAEVLARRVKNSPPARNEQKWLAGWKSRVRAYAP